MVCRIRLKIGGCDMKYSDKAYEYFESMRKRISKATTQAQLIAIMSEDMPAGYAASLKTQFNKQFKGKLEKIRRYCLATTNEYANNYWNNQVDEALHYMADKEVNQ